VRPETLSLLNVRVLDHLIIADAAEYSFADEGVFDVWSALQATACGPLAAAQPGVDFRTRVCKTGPLNYSHGCLTLVSPWEEPSDDATISVSLTRARSTNSRGALGRSIAAA